MKKKKQKQQQVQQEMHVKADYV